eukprot:3718971-Rhodomonas_salina.1
MPFLRHVRYPLTPLLRHVRYQVMVDNYIRTSDNLFDRRRSPSFPPQNSAVSRGNRAIYGGKSLSDAEMSAVFGGGGDVDPNKSAVFGGRAEKDAISGEHADVSAEKSDLCLVKSAVFGGSADVCGTAEIFSLRDPP